MTSSKPSPRMTACSPTSEMFARSRTSFKPSDGTCAALAATFDRYGLPLPADTWPDRAPRYESIRAACAAGVEAEIENGAMYDRLIAVTTHADIIEVFENLQRASQENHLAAFRRCTARYDGDPIGDVDGTGGRRGGIRRRRRHRGGTS